MEWDSQKWSFSLWHLVLQSWHLGRLRIYSVYSAANQFLQNLIQRGHNYTGIQKLWTKHIEIITRNIPALKKKKPQNGKKRIQITENRIWGFNDIHTLKTFNKQTFKNIFFILYSNTHVLQFATTVISYFCLSFLHLSYVYASHSGFKTHYTFTVIAISQVIVS